MKKFVALFFATWASYAFAGITITAPTNGSTVANSVQFVASGSSPACSKGIGGMGIYTAPFKLAYKVSGGKINTNLTLSNGTYNVTIQQWDNCGWSANKTITIYVGSSAHVVGGTGDSKSFVNLESDSHWNHFSLMPPSYNICGSCTSVEGNSMKFSIGGKTPFSDALWNQKFTTRLADEKSVPNYHDFVYDVWFFSSTIEKSQALEWDINQFFGGKSFIWGHECRIAGGHEWDTWDNVHMHWVKSGIPCNPKNNAWNHLTIHVQRTSDNRLYFKSITLNGFTASTNRYDKPTPTSWYGMTINYQQDGNRYQEGYSIYQDKISFFYK
jgi:hypothetical protein